jgi:hypothetical protein
VAYEEITAWGTVGLGVVTLLLAGGTLWAVWETRRDISETRRARIDASAPRIVILAHSSEAPPHLLVRNTPIGREIASDEDLRTSGDIDLALACALLIRNEGVSTAILVMPLEAASTKMLESNEKPPHAFIDGTSEDGWAQALTDIQQIPLRPGEQTVVWCRLLATVDDWLAATPESPRAFRIHFEAADARGTVTDRIDVHITARAVEKTEWGAICRLNRMATMNRTPLSIVVGRSVREWNSDGAA